MGAKKISWAAKKRKPSQINSNHDKLLKYQRIVRDFYENPRNIPDETFSKLLNALKELKEIAKAEELFKQVQANANPYNIKREAAGPWSYTSMMRIFRYQIEHPIATNDDSILGDINTLYEKYKLDGGIVDAYIAAEMIALYDFFGLPEKIKQVFYDLNKNNIFNNNHKMTPCINVYSKYINLLVESDEVAEAIKKLDELKLIYQNHRRLIQNEDEILMREIYGLLVEFYCVQGEFEKALQLYDDAIWLGLYIEEPTIKDYEEESLELRLDESQGLYGCTFVSCKPKLYNEKYNPDVIPTEFNAKERNLVKASLKKIDSHEYAKSEELSNELIKLQNEKHPWSFVHIGWFYHQRNQLDQAISAYDRAIKLINHDKNYYKFLSDILSKKGLSFYRKFKQSKKLKNDPNLINACECFREAIEMDPTNSEANVNWGVALICAEKYVEALKTLDQVKEGELKYSTSVVYKANCYKALKNTTKAIAIYKNEIETAKAIKNKKHQAWLAYELGDLYLQLYENTLADDYYNLARAYLKECAKLDSSRSSQVNFKLACLYKIYGNDEMTKIYQDKMSIDKLRKAKPSRTVDLISKKWQPVHKRESNAESEVKAANPFSQQYVIS